MLYLAVQYKSIKMSVVNQAKIDFLNRQFKVKILDNAGDPGIDAEKEDAGAKSKYLICKQYMVSLLLFLDIRDSKRKYTKPKPKFVEHASRAIRWRAFDAFQKDK